jgi:predicted outer membrane protein
MSMTNTKMLLSVVSLIPAFAIHAQQAPPVSPPTKPVVAVEASIPADALLANWLLAECSGEVALARIAVRRAHSAEVRQYAQAMIDEHARIEAELRPYAAAVAVESASPKSGNEAKKPARVDGDPVEAASSRPTKSELGFEHLALVRDLNERCTAEQKKVLEAQDSAGFDRTFLRFQVGAHTRSAIMADVFCSCVSGELRKVLERSGKSVRAQLAQAKHLCDKCEAAVAHAQEQRSR